MKTKGLRKGLSPVRLVTLGCSKNTVDSERLATQLHASDFEMIAENSLNSDPKQIVIINTCGFIENAKQESIETILQYADARQEGKIGKLLVMGCLSHRYRLDLEKEIPQVDAWYGTMELRSILRGLGADYRKELLGERRISTPSHTAFLKISEGCDRPCSFCAIPLMRGKHRSFSVQALLEEAVHLVQGGVKELVLIAQDLTYYGLDQTGQRELAHLLDRLSAESGAEWIRLQYAYPGQFPMEILPLIRDRENLCLYLDMPLQHASDGVLKRMRRGISARQTRKLLEDIRKMVPGIHLRTTMMVGFPGETDAEFQELQDFVSRMRLERMGVFTYSHEENTSAYLLEDDIPEELKQERADCLMALQQEISWDLNSRKVGQSMKVLLDREESKHWVGRSEFDSPEVDNEVLIPMDEYTRSWSVGSMVQVEILRAEEFDLVGKPSSV
ncbi:MAG: 30S ribosomal protein S12 methylthiotransferase RimO [Sphingomonadales bacterium]|nr:30S ribosomal protein S12 methylthiotransferase RimO [Sphingomonadales bacterium]